MNTRTRHSLSIDTIETLVSRREGITWREYAEQLGYAKTYAATLNKASRGVPGAMTLAAENILRAKLGLDVIETKPAQVCPSCLAEGRGMIVHGEGVDCHGKPVARVVIVSGKPRNRKKYHRPCLDDAEYARFLEWRRNA